MIFRPSRRAARARPEHAQPVDRAARGRGSGLGRDGTAPGGRVAAEDGRRGRLRRASTLIFQKFSMKLGQIVRVTKKMTLTYNGGEP